MQQKVRNPFFDNAKFFLMALVIFGHLLQPFIQKAQWGQDIYFFIYTFHMPAFIFISGYFSKSFDRKQGDQIRASFQRFILPYIFFQWLYSLYYWLTGSASFSFQLHVPNWSLWFLISSFFWQLSLFFFQRMPARIGISVSILLSLLVGYIPFVGRELTLQRTVVFLPFFVMGYYLEPQVLSKFIHFSKRRLFSLGFLILYGVIRATDGWNQDMFFGSKPYEDFLNFPEWGAIVRIVTLLLGCLGILAFFSLIPTRERRYTVCGQYTLVAYLLHGFIVQSLRKLNLESMPFNVWTLLILMASSLALTYMLASEPVGKFYSKVEQRILGYHSKNTKTRIYPS